MVAEGHRVRRKCGICEIKAVMDADQAGSGRLMTGRWFGFKKSTNDWEVGFKKSKNNWEVVNRRASQI